MLRLLLVASKVVSENLGILLLLCLSWFCGVSTTHMYLLRPFPLDNWHCNVYNSHLCALHWCSIYSRKVGVEIKSTIVNSGVLVSMYARSLAPLGIVTSCRKPGGVAIVPSGEERVCSHQDPFINKKLLKSPNI